MIVAEPGCPDSRAAPSAEEPSARGLWLTSEGVIVRKGFRDDESTTPGPVAAIAARWRSGGGRRAAPRGRRGVGRDGAVGRGHGGDAWPDGPVAAQLPRCLEPDDGGHDAAD